MSLAEQDGAAQIIVRKELGSNEFKYRPVCKNKDFSAFSEVNMDRVMEAVNDAFRDAHMSVRSEVLSAYNQVLDGYITFPGIDLLFRVEAHDDDVTLETYDRHGQLEGPPIIFENSGGLCAAIAERAYKRSNEIKAAINAAEKAR